MYIVRDIFQLQFGHFQEAKSLMAEAIQNKMMPENKAFRILSDFTGDSYRFIMEMGFDNLGEYEESLKSAMAPKKYGN